MDTALFIGLTHKGTLKRRMDVVAHNIANMNTTAFKQEKVVFQTLLVDAPSAQGADGGKIAYVVDKGIARDFSEGALVSTGNPLDIYLSAGGFLTVEDNQGDVLYTRNGRMRLDAERNLVTLSGEKIYDDRGAPIQFAANETSITISENGTITTEIGERGRLGIATFPDMSALKKRGNSLYETDQAPLDPDNAKQVTITSGSIEASNVNAIKSMVEMIDVSSAYSRATQSSKDIEDLQKEAIQRLGRTR